jgi:energy-coupling factor transporter ATP-binding protein EcfA2
MSDTFPICPYTGLRSFSEDESLYFKGREEDIDQATGQLQRNKFLMLTGASGDGKSSLVFAGIIPNARSGFLKAKYTNWSVAQFRPERSPFQNLCQALAKQLDIPNSFTVASELNHGFSALVDLYRNSKKFLDIHSDQWLQADDRKKVVMKREASNLIILVDQFEEFFTNPENYHHGAPSRDANLVLNLLLETARIALDEDIPIYIVFTMRSDYIGQCAAFRGLPEYIGFSQFFVPRLNRSQLGQVIEEPATLNGNQISRRLTERLIHDLTEGVDQLPILQHALKQIWLAADYGNEELDLIHYAMVGGMNSQELPDDQAQKFVQWFSGLSPEIKACYHSPSLQNVLNTHTNKLYKEAGGYYRLRTGKLLSEEQAKKIIRTVFTCLTKIDQGRAVRNRMTLQEITDIVGKPEFDSRAVGELLNIFREPRNTFINPFISDEDPESRVMSADVVLDITHESLIRNWQHLGQWAKEEFDSRGVSLDFERQLYRWIQSNRSDNFLLSIGPLTYFETWYNKINPNAFWIARYLPEETEDENRFRTADTILQNSNEFLKKSASKHVITRTFMRYGPKRIAAIIAIVALVVFSSFAVRDHYKKQNGYVLGSIHSEVMQLASDPKVDLVSKVSMIAEELKLGRSTVDEVAAAVKDTLQKIRVLNGLSGFLTFQGGAEPEEEIYRSCFLTDSLLNQLSPEIVQTGQLSFILNEMAMFRVALEMAGFNNPNEKISILKKRNAVRGAKWVLLVLNKQPAGFTDFQDFNFLLENAINYQVFTKAELGKLLGVLSPFENGLQSAWLRSGFAKEKLLVRGAERSGYGFNFNGLYQELAYLYAALGNSSKSLQCMDSLLKYSQNNYQGDYEGGGDNAFNIAAVFFLSGNSDQLDAFVDGYTARVKSNRQTFYEHTIGRAFRSFEATANLRLYSYMDEDRNLNLLFEDKKLLGFLFDKLRYAIRTGTAVPDEKNFSLALSYKNQGILESLYNDSVSLNEENTRHYFDTAFLYYRAVDPQFLAGGIKSIDSKSGSGDEVFVARKMLFLYPDIRTSFHPSTPRFYFYYYFSDVFIHYILRYESFDSLYPGTEEISYFTGWLEAYNTININSTAFANRLPRQEVLSGLAKALEKNGHAKNIDFNWLYLYLGKMQQDSGQLNEMQQTYDQITKANIFNLLQEKNFFGLIRDQSFRLIANAMEGYIKLGNMEKAHGLAAMFKNPVNRSSLYGYTACQLLIEKYESKLIGPLIDSAKIEMTRKENITNQQPNRRILAYALMLEDPSRNQSEAYALIRNLPTKFAAIQDIARAYAFRDQLYEAKAAIPDFISGSDQADFLDYILRGYSTGNSKLNANWESFDQSYAPWLNQNIKYVDENN